MDDDGDELEQSFLFPGEPKKVLALHEFDDAMCIPVTRTSMASVRTPVNYVLGQCSARSRGLAAPFPALALQIRLSSSLPLR